MDKKQEAKELLKEYNQEHISKFIDEIDEEKAEELIEQIHTIDFHQITELYNNTKKTIEFKESKIEPLKYLDKAKLTFEQTQRFDELGSDVVKKDYDPATVISETEMNRRMGITAEDLADFDEVDIE